MGDRYVCMVITYFNSRLWINRVRSILLVVCAGEMTFYLPPYAPENLDSL